MKTALITGASRGLGRALALAYARAGYDVAVHFHQNEFEAKITAAAVGQIGQKSLLLKADIRRSSDVDSLIKTMKEKWGRVDVLVNNAGSVRNKTIATMTDEEWRDALATNLDGPFYATRAVIPLMRAQQGGSILNIASFIAGKGARGAANYAAAKAGLITLTKNTALEEGKNHIRANALMPGFHVTDINKEVWGKYEAEIRKQHLLPEMPNRDEMAAFAVSVSELKSVTGQVFSFESRIL